MQAAIAALHARALQADDTDWAQIDALYAALERMQPSPVITLNRAVAVSKTQGAAPALAMIEPLADSCPGTSISMALKGALLLQLGRAAEARTAFDHAIAWANTAAEAVHIRMQIDRLIRWITNRLMRVRPAPVRPQPPRNKNDTSHVGSASDRTSLGQFVGQPPMDHRQSGTPPPLWKPSNGP